MPREILVDLQTEVHEREATALYTKGCGVGSESDIQIHKCK
jgi:hypothetical protein